MTVLMAVLIALVGIIIFLYLVLLTVRLFWTDVFPIRSWKDIVLLQNNTCRGRDGTERPFKSRA